MIFRIRRPLLLPARSQRFVRWGHRLLLTAGIVALAYVGLTLLDAKLYQAYQTRRFQQELKDSQASIVGGGLVPTLEEAKPARAESLGPTDSRRSPLGRIEISTIGLSAMILEGMDERTLRRAVGHIPGTPLPGQPGNVALAGHRDTFFRGLRNIREGDEITLQTLSGLYRYRVDSTKVVDPGETQVLDSSDNATLTLVTCYPFSYLGPAPKRFIVSAHKLAATATGPVSAGVMARGMR
jgi:sortase A